MTFAQGFLIVVVLIIIIACMRAKYLARKEAERISNCNFTESDSCKQLPSSLTPTPVEKKMIKKVAAKKKTKTRTKKA